MSDYWLKQSPDEPLFPDVLWSRPETKRQAGKLLIIGGHKESFAGVAQAYGAATKAGAGHIRVLMPGSLEKSVAKIFPDAEYADSTPSGSFSRAAAGQAIELAEWADGVLLAGDFGNNAETTIFLETIATKYGGQITLAGDSIDLYLHSPDILDRLETVMVTSVSKLQKLQSYLLTKPILQRASAYELAEALRELTEKYPIGVVTTHESQIFVASQEKVSTTAGDGGLADIAAHASVWWLQQPADRFKALSCAVFDYIARDKINTAGKGAITQ